MDERGQTIKINFVCYNFQEVACYLHTNECNCFQFSFHWLRASWIFGSQTHSWHSTHHWHFFIDHVDFFTAVSLWIFTELKIFNVGSYSWKIISSPKEAVWDTCPRRCCGGTGQGCCKRRLTESWRTFSQGRGKCESYSNSGPLVYTHCAPIILTSPVDDFLSFRHIYA